MEREEEMEDCENANNNTYKICKKVKIILMLHLIPVLISIIIMMLLPGVFIIVPFCFTIVYLIAIIYSFLLSNLARKVFLVVQVPILAALCILWYVSIAMGSWGVRYNEIEYIIMFLPVALITWLSGYTIYYFTRSKVKEQFK